jgi:TetR/AcrR family transcriptional repressor of nem operon
MARTKAFEPIRALDKALTTFWCQGYEATSVQDLLDAMGINRGSLYDTFGDKHQLFLAALDRYVEQSLEELQRALNGEDVFAAIHNSLMSIVTTAAQEPVRRGCLLVNSATELSARDPVVAAKVAATLQRMEDIYATALRRMAADDEAVQQPNAADRARFIVTQVVGLHVLAKAGVSTTQLTAVVDQSMRALKMTHV